MGVLLYVCPDWWVLIVMAILVVFCYGGPDWWVLIHTAVLIGGCLLVQLSWLVLCYGGPDWLIGTAVLIGHWCGHPSWFPFLWLF